MVLVDRRGQPLTQGIYVDLKSKNPALNYSFVVLSVDESFDLQKDYFPPRISCLTPETQASRSLPLTPELRRALLTQNGKGFQEWLDRQLKIHSELSNLTSLLS